MQKLLQADNLAYKKIAVFDLLALPGVAPKAPVAAEAVIAQMAVMPSFGLALG
jgi:hypothetical protein